jgi:hypothetical protein
VVDTFFLFSYDPVPSITTKFLTPFLSDAGERCWGTRRGSEKSPKPLSTSEIQEKIIRLSRIIPSLLTLHGGYGKVTLVRFEDNGSRVTWSSDCPFN